MKSGQYIPTCGSMIMSGLLSHSYIVLEFLTKSNNKIILLLLAQGLWLNQNKINMSDDIWIQFFCREKKKERKKKKQMVRENGPRVMRLLASVEVNKPEK